MKLSWRGANVLFFACSGVQYMSDGHVDAFMPLLLHEYGLSGQELAVWVGVLVAVMHGAAFSLAPFWGVLAERFSRRKILLRSYLLYVIAMLLLAWAPDVGWLVPARILIGLGSGTTGVIVATQSLLVPRREVGASIAMVQAAMPIAASLGPPLGALAIPWIGLRGLFVVDAVAMLAVGLALLVLMPEPARPVRRGSVLGRTGEVVRLAWSLPPVRWNFISAAALRGATTVVDAYLPVRIAQLAADPVTAIGWILGLYGALTSVATWYVGRILQRVEAATVYTRAVFAATLVAAGMAAAPNIWVLGLVAILRSVPVAWSNTVLYAHNAAILPAANRTALLSLSPVPRKIGALLFPALAAVAAGLGPGMPLAVGALSYAGATLAGRQLSRASREYLADPRSREAAAELEGAH